MPINKKILLVEDDMITAAVESAMLKKNGFDVITSSTGENAVEIVKSQAVDLVLMDIDLGHGISGPETAEIILDRSSIPIVFLTSHSEKEMVDKVSTITRYGYVIKNSGDFVLLSSIKMAFELYEAFQKLEETNRELTALNKELNNTNAEIIKTNLQLMQYQNNLEMSEEKFRQLFENMTEGVAIHELCYDSDGNAIDYRILSVNKSYEKHTGIPAYKASDMLASRLYGTGVPPYIEEYEKVTRTGTPVIFDTYFEKMDKHFHIGVISLGRPFFATIFEDITQRIKTEEKVIESERKYRNLYEFSQVGFFETDLANARVVMCNQRYCDMAGFSSVDEAIGSDILHLYVDPQAREEVKRIMHSQGYIAGHIIHLRNRKTGKIFWGEFSARLNPERDVAEGSIIDITNLKMAEAELRDKNEKLQKTMEELESTNEELSGAMEELEAGNEELTNTNIRLIEHQKELMLSEERLRIFINSIPDIVCFKDGNGRWLEANDFSLELFKLKNTEFKGKKDSELAFYSPQFRDALLYSEHTDEAAWQAGRISRSDEIIPGMDSQPKIFDIIKVPVFSNDGSRQGLIVIGRDMTKRVETENTIRSLLHEKDILLQEVHHRIKNNMYTISNLLYLQSESLTDQSAVTALNDARNRIQSMMIIYDKLYRSSDYKNISVKNYLNNLIDEIFSVYPQSEKIKIEKNLDDFVINSNTLFHIGIIVNEIITNSFKYAFPDVRKGVIKIRAEQINDNLAEISISDDGIGFYSSEIIQKKSGFGLNLITLLVEQMNATVELNGHEGTDFRIRFMLY